MNQELLEKVLKCPRLPSLPTIAIEVIDLCRQSDVNLNQIAHIISNDPALSTKILRTVNSSYYGLSKSVSTISHALVILGLNSVKTLALGFSLVNNFKELYGPSFDPTAFWRRSLYSAVAARTVARCAGLEEHEEAFLGGLLKDLGVMAMLQALGDQYVEVLDEAGPQHAELWKIERKTLDLDHCQVGAALAAQWKLPPVLVEPIEHHELPNKASADQQKLVRCVAAGATVADMFLDESPQTSAGELFETWQDWFGLDAAAGEDIINQIQARTKELAKLFDLDAGAARNAGEILAEANETLQELTLESQMNQVTLQQQNQQLQEQATRDALTGAANRGHFDQYLHTQFAQSRRQTQPLSVIFSDADKFKSVNDTYGHLVGDQVLVCLASVLHEHVASLGVVARYGGEEFAVVLPNMARQDAARLAERIRKAVEAVTIDAGEGISLHITVSLGVATFDGVRFFEQPEQLVNAADQAVYAAKKSGRNCVRVFAPKTPTPQPQT